MAKKKQRRVTQRPDGKWENKLDGNERATSVHNTQRDAEQAARENLRNQGGGELNVHSTDGKIRKKDTVPPGNDPYPPKG
ncbi:MAG: DUF2188 domain-containing protein [Chloroflexota bacterium]